MGGDMLDGQDAQATKGTGETPLLRSMGKDAQAAKGTGETPVLRLG